MSNRETFPVSLSPLKGDIFAAAGARQASVIGLQGTPISPASPIDQNLLVFEGSTGQWTPAVGTGTAITINGVPTSDDYDVYVNSGPLVKVNGV